MIITVAGSPGSGKSSTAKGLAEALGYEHFSSGDFFRGIAAQRGLSVEALNLTAEEQHDIDALVDGMLREIGETKDHIVIDSRMAWHWIPDSFKIFLKLDEETAAERIFASIRKHGRVSETAATIADMRASMERRFASEQKRYMDLYGVDPSDSNNYDLVINTKHNGKKKVLERALAVYEAWRSAASHV